VVGTAQRRTVVSFVQQEFGLSERRACQLIEQPRASHRYEHRRRTVPRLLERLVALAEKRRRFGYPRLHLLLRREGFQVSRKLVYRLYRDAGLKLRTKRKKSRSAELRRPILDAHWSNDRWSMDFVSDTLGDGRCFRALTIVDDFTKLCPAIEVDTSISGVRVTRVLDRAIQLRGQPQVIVVDNGPEFRSKALDAWAKGRGIHLHWIDPGKPTQNAYIESFNGRFRDECLNQHSFLGLDDARALIEGWRDDYNRIRPHTSLGGASPEEFILSLAGRMRPARLNPPRQLELFEENPPPPRLS
jgi:putative transposase